MAVRFLKKHAAREGLVSVEDAEVLANWLREQARPTVHLGKCEEIHAAVLQVLLALRPRIAALPSDPWLRAALAPG